MKKIALTLIAIAFIVNFSYAQWTGGPTGAVYYNGGSVGIGTTTPPNKLSVAVASAFVPFSSQAGSGGEWAFGQNVGSTSGDDTFVIYSYTWGSAHSSKPVMQFNSNGNTFFNPDGGNLGIGTVSPADILDVQKNQNAITNFYFRNTDATNTSSRAYLNIISGGNALSLRSLNGDNNYLSFASGNFGIQYQSNNPALTVLSNGNVGIGTASPNGVFHINNNVGYVDNAANQLMLTNSGYRSSGSGTLTVDNAAMAFYFTNYNAGGKMFDRTLDIRVRGASDGTYGASIIRFFANDYTSGSAEREIMRIHGNGSVLIGKTTQVNTAYKLDVAGPVRANEIVVNTTGADFVFEPTYKLPSISSVEKYIKDNHHLTEIPSAKEMQNKA